MSPTSIGRTEYVKMTSQVDAGCIRAVHRVDGTGTEFYVMFWSLPEGFRVFRAEVGRIDFTMWEFADHSAACKQYLSLADARAVPALRMA